MGHYRSRDLKSMITITALQTKAFGCRVLLHDRLYQARRSEGSILRNQEQAGRLFNKTSSRSGISQDARMHTQSAFY